MFLLPVLAASASLVAINDRQSRLTALYEDVCLKAFPDDAAVAVLMKAQNARELSVEEVKVTMVDDPARAWELPDQSATIWLELPPYHACSVRWNAPQLGDLTTYRAIADRYEATLGGFQPIKPFDADYGDIHVHAIGEKRKRTDVPAESLFIFDQKITDAKRRQAGETGLSLRFVHQLAPPADNAR